MKSRKILSFTFAAVILFSLVTVTPSSAVYKGSNAIGSTTVNNEGKFLLSLKSKQKANSKLTFKVELEGQTSKSTVVRVIPRPPA